MSGRAWRCANANTLDALRPDISGATIRAAWHAGGLASLVAIIPAAADIARRYHSRPPSLRAVKREAIANAAGYCGVEYLGERRRGGGSVYYANAGDAYASTLLFCGARLYVGTWAGVVEARGVVERAPWC